MNTDLAAQRAIDLWEDEGFEALSETDRTLAAVWLFAAGVGNTGFEGFLHGSRGDLAFAVPAALRTVGATQLADLAQRANALFGPDGPPRDRDTRRRALDFFSGPAREQLRTLDQAYYACSEDVDALLDDYLAAKPGTH